MAVYVTEQLSVKKHFGWRTAEDREYVISTKMTRLNNIKRRKQSYKTVYDKNDTNGKYSAFIKTSTRSFYRNYAILFTFSCFQWVFLWI